LRATPNRELVKSVNKHVIRRAQRYARGTDKTELSFVAKHLSQEAHLDIDFFRTPRAQLALGERPASNAKAPVQAASASSSPRSTPPLLRGHLHFWLGRVSLRCVNLALRRQRSHV
jgi:hypothetical protein